MHVSQPDFRLTIPGHRIIAPYDIQDKLKKQWEWAVKGFVDELVGEYCSAWASLILFEQFFEAHKVRSLADAKLAEEGNLQGIEKAREKRLPSAIETHFHAIQRDAFIYTVARIGNVINLGPENDPSILAPIDLKRFKLRLEKDFPDVVHIRNSLAHAEERRRGIKNGGGPMPPHVSFINMQAGDRLTTLGADGQLKSISLSIKSLFKLQQLLNDLFATFEWYGEPEKWPLQT